MEKNWLIILDKKSLTDVDDLYKNPKKYIKKSLRKTSNECALRKVCYIVVIYKFGMVYMLNFMFKNIIYLSNFIFYLIFIKNN
jgi:hypothetical protein